MDGARAAGAPPLLRGANGFRVGEFESLNERATVRVAIRKRPEPDSVVHDRILLDPNPQADTLTFGKTRLFEWQDSNGIQWAGGLLFRRLVPRDSLSARGADTRVRTRRSLLTGWSSSAGHDGVCGSSIGQRRHGRSSGAGLPRAIAAEEQEGPAAAEGYRAAIERLIEDRVVDASRVGLIAFSRTGYHALHLLAKYPHLLKAVTISDALQAGYWQYITVAANRTDAEISVSRLTGGIPEVATIENWFARNPIYKIGDSTAAVLLEETGRSAGLGMWETYTILRRSRRPVEFVLFPEGSHLLKKPLERLASQGGNLDWFRFWLQGYEDSAPEKQARYVRWRSMAEATRRE